MDVRCERCKNQYVVDDARVPETGLVVACDKCGHEFLLRKKALSISLPIKPGESSGGRSLSTLAPGTSASAPEKEAASDSTAIRLATSPEAWPPRPSATQKRPASGMTRKASSLWLRRRPTSVVPMAARRMGGS